MSRAKKKNVTKKATRKSSKKAATRSSKKKLSVAKVRGVLAIKIGNIVRDLRKRDGMSQADLAKRLGCASSRASFLESGNNEPRLATLLQLSDIFNVSLTYLVGKEDAQIRPTAAPAPVKVAYAEVKGLIVARKRGKVEEEEE